jgi:hypothetical protein
MAPEQYADARNADERSDIYGLGSLLYAMHTGDLRPLAIDHTRLTPGIEMIIEKCRQPRPEARYQTVEELKTAWLTVASQTAALAQHEELDQWVKYFASTKTPEESDVDRFVELVSTFMSEADVVHDVVTTLPPQVVRLIYSRHRAFARNLIAAFVAHATSQGWSFSYTDKIANVCHALFQTIPDFIIRGDLIYCTAEVGTSHNRWHVEGICRQMLEAKKMPGESLAIIDKFNMGSDKVRKVRRDLRKLVSASSAETVLKEFFDKGDDDE